MEEDEWAGAFEGWLEGQDSEHTRRAYRQAWASLLTQAGKMPWEIQRGDLLSWVAAQQRRGTSPGSIRLRLAAVRSFYRQLGSLGVENPAAEVRLSRGERGGRLSSESAEAFLRAIPTNTLNGSRDYALFLCYLISGQGNRQVRLLKHEQVIRKGERTWLVWRGKGGSRRELCPERLGEAIDRYLHLCGLGDKQAGGYLFTAWPRGRSRGTPLSPSTVCKLVKKYARGAGLGVELTVRDLVNTARAERRHECHR